MSDEQRRTAESQLLLKVPDVARMLGIGTTRLYELLAAGELPSVKLSTTARRIPRDAVEEFIARLRDGYEPPSNSRPRRGRAKAPAREAGVSRRRLSRGEG